MNYLLDMLLVFFFAGLLILEGLLRKLCSNLWSEPCCPFILIQNRTLLLMPVSQFMMFILRAGICSGIIYYFSER